MKWISFAVGSTFLAGAAVFTAVKFGDYERIQLAREVERLEEERQQLVDYAMRMASSRRVAQAEVVRQYENALGQTVSTLIWQEIGPEGELGNPVAAEVVGKQAYFEAMIIKFDHRYIQEADPARGSSLALFRRIFGDQQTAEGAPELAALARPPRRSDTPESKLHAELWARFWEMIDDPALAAQYGARVVQIEAPAIPLRENDIWEVTLDAVGGLNVKKIGRRAAADLPAMTSGPTARTTRK